MDNKTKFETTLQSCTDEDSPLVKVVLPATFSLTAIDSEIIGDNNEDTELEGVCVEARRTMLEFLNLGWKNMSALPVLLTTVTSLTRLNLERNVLERLPRELANLSSLQILDLSFNPLHQYDFAALVELSELRTLYLTGVAPMNKLPPALCSITSLTTLSLAGCELDEIPKTIGNLQQLKILSLCGNLLKSLPTAFSRLIGLEALDLRDNLLRRDLPNRTLTSLTSLKLLDLTGNEFTEEDAAARVPVALVRDVSSESGSSYLWMTPQDLPGFMTEEIAYSLSEIRARRHVNIFDSDEDPEFKTQ